MPAELTPDDLDWLIVAEWHKRTEWEGLCDHVDFDNGVMCAKPGAEILAIGIRYAHRCVVHAEKWRMNDESMARLRGRIVKGLNTP